ncbi:MAG TPA: acyl-CoA dehydrogenase family protein [Actinomycetota bacterium]|nr:acyl-CoA dehydrogenase family protein [Actinomycetota bacterium]
MDFSVAPELEEVRSSYRSFLEREVRPVENRFAQQLQGDEWTPEMREAGMELRRKSAEIGYYGAHLPEDVGGWGLSTLGMTLLVEETGRSGLRFATYVLGPPNPEAPTPLLLEGTPEQQKKYLVPLIKAEKTMCFALTEPDAGSDAQSIRTRAVKDGDHYVINGVKHFITNGERADFAVVFAVTDPDKRAQGGITAFIVEKGTPGYTVGKKQRTMAGDSNQSELIFEDCRVPAANILGPEGYGFFSAMKFLNAGRAYIGAMCLGISDYLIRICTEYANERKAFGKPIGKFQAIQWMLADSAVEVEAARWLTYRLAWMCDQGEQPMRESSMVKLYNTEMVGRVADRAVQIYGGMGYLTEGPVERIFRWVRMLRIVEGTSEIQRLVIARTLGL